MFTIIIGSTLSPSVKVLLAIGGIMALGVVFEKMGRGGGGGFNQNQGNQNQGNYNQNQNQNYSQNQGGYNNNQNNYPPYR